jgi:hypothetical protein
MSDRVNFYTTTRRKALYKYTLKSAIGKDIYSNDRERSKYLWDFEGGPRTRVQRHQQKVTSFAVLISTRVGVCSLAPLPELVHGLSPSQ